MPARNRRSRLALSTLLAVLLVSCGTQNESSAGSSAELSPESSASSAESSAESSVGSAPAPAGQVPLADRQPGRQPDRGPGGNPPGVRHDLPRVGNNLTSQGDWDQARRNACREAGQSDNCLRAVYQVRRRDSSGRLTPIPNPGPGYADGEEPEFDSCTVSQISPPTGADRQVPAGSTITISIICIPREPETTPSSPTARRPSPSGTEEPGN
jgi:hypothetical protein